MLVPNEQQSRELQRMLAAMERFRRGEEHYFHFVSMLEGALDNGEFRDKGFVEAWYDLWSPLEELRALHGNDVRIDEVDGFISDLEAYVRGVLTGSGQ